MTPYMTLLAFLEALKRKISVLRKPGEPVEKTSRFSRRSFFGKNRFLAACNIGKTDFLKPAQPISVFAEAWSDLTRKCFYGARIFCPLEQGRISRFLLSDAHSGNSRSFPAYRANTANTACEKSQIVSIAAVKNAGICLQHTGKP